MYESGPLLGTRAKYRKLSFMSSDAILSARAAMLEQEQGNGTVQPHPASHLVSPTPFTCL
ncbi:hypothetical protein EYF80_039374 [Liparis tanakae]|uniref:Uncharacterized protein n=1 Tax=Liparis tanakae TaxID=230148 RepID=A0A4Z2GAB4_9TELE|nr:hypothetical protein EYF80_039374 [Liparis tanakae]